MGFAFGFFCGVIFALFMLSALVYRLYVLFRHGP
jgi:hypothetical protein